MDVLAAGPVVAGDKNEDSKEGWNASLLDEEYSHRYSSDRYLLISFPNFFTR
jgi:hypothetical protein